MWKKIQTKIFFLCIQDFFFFFFSCARVPCCDGKRERGVTHLVTDYLVAKSWNSRYWTACIFQPPKENISSTLSGVYPVLTDCIVTLRVTRKRFRSNSSRVRIFFLIQEHKCTANCFVIFHVFGWIL